MVSRILPDVGRKARPQRRTCTANPQLGTLTGARYSSHTWGRNSVVEGLFCKQEAASSILAGSTSVG